MPRKVEIKCAKAACLTMARGDRRETLGGTGGKTGGRVHADTLVTSRYHIVADTPEPNFVAGTTWLPRTSSEDEDTP